MTASGFAPETSWTPSISPLSSAASTTDRGGRLVHAVADRTQRARQQPVRDQLASLILFDAIAVERRAPGHAVRDRIERDSSSQEEGLVIKQRGLALRVAGQRVHPVFGQPHHRTEVSQPLIMRVGIDDRVHGGGEA